MSWNEQDHPRDGEGKFTFKNGGSIGKEAENKTHADILYSKSNGLKEAEMQKRKRKGELLKILGNHATSGDILLADNEKLEKKIKELGLGGRLNDIEGEITGGAEGVSDLSNKETFKVKLKDKIQLEERKTDLQKNNYGTTEPFKLRVEYNENYNKENNSAGNNKIKDEKFNNMMEHIYRTEGGFVDNKNDRGGRTNKGITQRTFDAYNKKTNRPIKDVKYITKDEADEIYYKEYYLASGADKIKDKNLRYLHYDSAINHGVGRAKKFLEQSGGDFDRYMTIRNNFYDSLAKDQEQKEFYNGWKNRTKGIQKMKDENILED